MSIHTLSRKLAVAGVQHVVVQASEAKASNRIDAASIRTAWYTQSKMPKQQQKKFDLALASAYSSLHSGASGWKKSISELKVIFDKYPINDMVYNTQEDELEPMSWNDLEKWAREQAKEYAIAEYPEGKDSEDEDEVEKYEQALSREYDSIIENYTTADSNDLMRTLLLHPDIYNAVN